MSALVIVGCAGLVLAALAAAILPDVLRAKRVSAAVGALACVALAAAGALGVFSSSLTWDPFHWDALGSGGIRVDQLTALFVLVCGAASAPLFLATTGGSRRAAARIPAALRPLLVLVVAAVFLVDNVFEFLIAYELVAITIFALVGVRYHERAAGRAAALTITLAKLGGGAILAALLLLAAKAGTFSFSELAARGPHLDAGLRGVCFALLFAGFGVKAAMVPLQTWLPGAYGETSAESAGFIGAISLNVAFYGMLRTWFDFLGHPATWWAVSALLIGAITALLGILGGVLQRRLRLFVAYSSIENSGIIVAGFGLALMGAAQREPGLLGLGLVASTFQIAAHTVAKAGLFTAVASVERTTGTSDMERLGGLHRVLPWATVGTLAGGAALSALPPFSGFVSEWLGLEGLMQGFRVSGTGSHVAMALAGAILALTAGLAALAFVRAIGMTFLGMPRDEGLSHRRDTRGRQAALGVLSAGSLALGLAAPWVVRILERGTAAIGGRAAFERIAQPGWLIEPNYPSFASISPTILMLSLLGFGAGFWCLRLALRPRRRTRRVPVWASGVVATGPREQYTAIGYANMVRVIFNVVYRVRTQFQAHGDERFPERLSMVREEPRIFEAWWLYRPVSEAFLRIADAMRHIQAGPLGLYLLYLLLATTALLIIAPRVS